MKEPFGKRANPHLIYEKYKNCVFYHVSNHKGEQAIIEPCILRIRDNNRLKYVTFNKKWELSEWGYPITSESWENLFLNYNEAKKLAKERNDRFLSFRHEPFLSHKVLQEHFDELKKTEELIDKLLSGFENYGGIDFCDVSAGGIQIRIHHNSISGYTFGDQKTILYDFSNIKEIPFEVAEEFIRIDNPKAINKEKAFIAYGEKYGWD